MVSVIISLLLLLILFAQINAFYFLLQDKLFLVNITNNEFSEREIIKVTLAIVSKRINYLGINLIKEVKDLYNENCRQ